MKERTQALILMKQKYREYDELIWLYTEEYGLLSAVIHGIKRKKTKFSGELPLFALVYIEIKRTKGLSTIYNFEIIESNVPDDAVFLCYTHGGAMSELTRRLLSDYPPIRGVFTLLAQLFAFIPQVEQPELLLVYLKQRLLPYTGSQIALDGCVSCGQTTDIVGYCYRLQGIVCKNCQHELDVRDIRELAKIKVLVAFFRLELEALSTLVIDEAAQAFLISFWDELYANNLGITLKSQGVLERMKAMKEGMSC